MAQPRTRFLDELPVKRINVVEDDGTPRIVIGNSTPTAGPSRCARLLARPVLRHNKRGPITPAAQDWTPRLGPGVARIPLGTAWRRPSLRARARCPGATGCPTGHSAKIPRACCPRAVGNGSPGSQQRTHGCSRRAHPRRPNGADLISQADSAGSIPVTRSSPKPQVRRMARAVNRPF
jgi:hypothetical protein